MMDNKIQSESESLRIRLIKNKKNIVTVQYRVRGCVSFKCFSLVLRLRLYLVNLFQNITEETATDSVPFQECLYYLKSYTPFNIIIDFYRRNGYWMKAVQYILDHVCIIEVRLRLMLWCVMPLLAIFQLDCGSQFYW